MFAYQLVIRPGYGCSRGRPIAASFRRCRRPTSSSRCSPTAASRIFATADRQLPELEYTVQYRGDRYELRLPADGGIWHLLFLRAYRGQAHACARRLPTAHKAVPGLASAPFSRRSRASGATSSNSIAGRRRAARRPGFILSITTTRKLGRHARQGEPTRLLCAWRDGDVRFPGRLRRQGRGTPLRQGARADRTGQGQSPRRHGAAPRCFPAPRLRSQSIRLAPRTSNTSSSRRRTRTRIDLFLRRSRARPPIRRLWADATLATVSRPAAHPQGPRPRRRIPRWWSASRAKRSTSTSRAAFWCNSIGIVRRSRRAGFASRRSGLAQVAARCSSAHRRRGDGRLRRRRPRPADRRRLGLQRNNKVPSTLPDKKTRSGMSHPVEQGRQRLQHAAVRRHRRGRAHQIAGAKGL